MAMFSSLVLIPKPTARHGFVVCNEHAAMKISVFVPFPMRLKRGSAYDPAKRSCGVSLEDEGRNRHDREDSICPASYLTLGILLPNLVRVLWCRTAGRDTRAQQVMCETYSIIDQRPSDYQSQNVLQYIKPDNERC